jgi:hypothetical protein
MPESRYPCPECGTVLRPAHPVPAGKKIKCPKCATIFPVGGATVAQPAKAAAAAPKPAPPPKPAKPASADDDDEGGGTYTFVAEEAEADSKKPKLEFGSLRDKFPKKKRGPALEAVVKPSRSMLYIGVINFGIMILLFCYGFWPLVFTDKFPEPYEVGRCVGVMFGALIGMGVCSMIVHGAASMANLESYGWSMTAAIFCSLQGISLPINLIVMSVTFSRDELGTAFISALASLLNASALSIGIWSIVTLNKDFVKEGYRETAKPDE